MFEVVRMGFDFLMSIQVLGVPVLVLTIGITIISIVISFLKGEK